MFSRFLVVLILLCAGSSTAQRYSFLTFGTAQGLPQSQVTSITQDERGYLWIGTLGGLARFNGRDFETFTTDKGLLNNRITFLTFIDDQLWIGHEGGVSVMGAQGIKKWQFSGERSRAKVSDIIEYNDRIVVSTNGEGLFSLTQDGFKKISLPGEDALRIRDLEIVQDELYLATRGGLLRSGSLKQWKTTLGELSISSVKNYKGKLYVTSFQDGLYSYDPSNGSTVRIGEKDSISTLRFCFFDGASRMWLNTTQGLWRWKKGKVDLKLNLANGLPMESIQAMFEDRDGNLWLGTEGKGLVRFTGETFVYFNENTGLPSELIVSVDQDAKGVYWFGTYDKGLIRMGRNGTFSTVQLDNQTVWCSMMDVDGSNWFGTNSGLFRLNDGRVTGQFYADQGTPGDKITALYKKGPSQFYVGGSDGVSVWNNDNFRLLKSDGIETVRSFCEMKGDVFCATDNGLYHVRENGVELVRNFAKAVALCTDNKGRLWIGTEEGLFRWEGGRFHEVPFALDPGSNFINFLSLRESYLYVGTNNGVYVLNTQNKDLPVNRYGIGEGVVNLETNLNSSFFDKKGHLWFGTASGLVCFRPEKDPGNAVSPSLVLRNILINYGNADYRKYAKDLDQYGTPFKMSLPFNRNNVSFELDAVALANFPGLKFQYKLDGLHSDWSPLHATTSITYSAIPAGKYVFRARCVDSRGRISAEVMVPFVVMEAFYRTWWFLLLCALTVGGMGWLIFRQRLVRERESNEKERLEYRSRLLTLEQRSLNASMNRHFIFNSLNSIQYFINTQDKLSANKFLTNFAKLIRKNLDSSEEGNMVTLGQELERLELYLSLERMRFKDKFDFEIDCEESIDKDAIVIPAMILQPFVENSIIHGILPNEGVKGAITVKISSSGHILTIEITDNGIGIEKSRGNKLEGEGDHRSKGMEITSKRIDLLNKLSDKHFEIIGPFQINDQYRKIKGTVVTLKMETENLDD